VTSLYSWLKFLHLVGVAAFLLGHGISAGCSFGLRARPSASYARALLELSRGSYAVAYPGLAVVIGTGVWMGFAGHWWSRGWIWAAIVVLVVIYVVMAILSEPYHAARDAGEDEVVLRKSLARTRPLAATLTGTAALLALVFLMVFKPF
jgi:uncharacterized membrane protein